MAEIFLVIDAEIDEDSQISIMLPHKAHATFDGAYKSVTALIQTNLELFNTPYEQTDSDDQYEIMFENEDGDFVAIQKLEVFD
jgi:hypothetical protein